MYSIKLKQLLLTVLGAAAIAAGSAHAAGLDDFTAGGVKLRGDGSVDDNGRPDVGGIKRRGDGSIDDNGPSGRSRIRLDKVQKEDRSTLASRSDVRTRVERAEKAERPEKAERRGHQ